MRYYELIKETFLRKHYIFLVHISWFITYALLFLMPFPPGEGWNWGIFLFGWSGCLLPLLVSAGIFGDDIASGRICILITKPMHAYELYLCRVFGLSLQAALHIAFSGFVIFVLHTITGKGSIDRFGYWLFSAWLMFNTWAAISTSLSIIVKRAHNSMLLFLGIIIVYFLMICLMGMFREEIITVLIRNMIKFAFPPVELQVSFANGKYEMLRSFGCLVHIVGLTALYCLAGIILLNKSEFKQELD